jgi:hypothetical protein
MAYKTKEAARAAQRRYVARHGERITENARKRNQRYRERHPGRKTYHTWLRIIEKNGWTEEAYNRAAAAQDNRCAICEASVIGRLCGDHSHQTMKRRGLLCRNCNLMLGNAKDSISTLLAAAEYLRVYSE